MFYFILYFSLSSTASAVDVCLGAHYERDPFTNTETVSYGNVGYQLARTETGGQLQMSVARAGAHPDVLRQGFELVWLLENGVQISMSSPEPASPTGHTYVSTYSYGAYTTWKPRFSVSAEASHAMAQSRPTMIRYSLLGEQFTEELSARLGRTYQRQFACIANGVAFPAEPPSVNAPAG